MESKVRNAIVKVEVKRDGKIISRGTASLVREDLLLSALHVVVDREAAVKLTPQEGNAPLPVLPGEISVTFWNGWVTAARVIEGKWDAREDWVLLECTPPAPGTIRPLPLGTIDRDGDQWETHGYPDAKADGLTIGGSVT